MTRPEPITTEDAAGRSAVNSIEFESLIKKYYGGMLLLATNITGAAIADEVVQEACFSAFRALDRFEGRSSVKTWLYRITANEAYSRLRKNKRQINLEDIANNAEDFLEHRFNEQGHWQLPPGNWQADSPEDLLNIEQLKHCIDLTLKELPELQKSVFSLKEMESMSLDDIGNILELNASHVRVLLHRARLKLFSIIDHYKEYGECLAASK